MSERHQFMEIQDSGSRHAYIRLPDIFRYHRCFLFKVAIASSCLELVTPIGIVDSLNLYNTSATNAAQKSINFVTNAYKSEQVKVAKIPSLEEFSPQPGKNTLSSSVTWN